MAKAPDLQSVARVALAGLFEATHVDAGAVLLLPRFMKAEPAATDLEVIASKTESELNYQRVSNFMAATVLREGEAVLARNVMGDIARCRFGIAKGNFTRRVFYAHRFERVNELWIDSFIFDTAGAQP